MYSFARAIKTVRLANNLTQSEFSEQIGITPSFVGQLEQGKALPSYEVLNRIIVRFSVDANIFFGGGSVPTTIDNSFYKLVSAMSQEQLQAMRELLKFVTNVSNLSNDARDNNATE